MSLVDDGVLLNERERIVAVLRGERPETVPWATRLDIWARSLRSDEVMQAYGNLDLPELHRALGVGRQSYLHLAKHRLVAVEMTVETEGEVVGRTTNPVLKFPVPVDLVPSDRPGRTTVRFATPVGTASLEYKRTTEMIEGNTAPYLTKHIITNADDYPVVHWILEHVELVDQFEPFDQLESEIGGTGIAVGMMGRTPFQQIVLDYLGAEYCFFELYDNRKRIEKLLALLTEISEKYLRIALASKAAFLEFSDNYDGTLTNPELFQRYCAPHLAQAADRIHAKGKVLGSHMDGDLSALTDEIAACGVDVVESFSPWPLTSLRFEEACRTWAQKPILWGVLSSPIFEPNFPEDKFEQFVRSVLETNAVRAGMILGIADQAVQHTLPSRIRRVRELITIESHHRKEHVE